MVLRKRIQGELFDCTVQGYNDNGHGKHKIYYALQYGISIPIQKYIDELVMIHENTVDDKSQKRKERLIFLNKVSEVPVLVYFFSIFTTYLNGGDNLPSIQLPNIDDNFDTNKLIVTAAGGNIITIFAKLLDDLLLYGTRTPVVFNQQILREGKLKDGLLNWRGRCDGEFGRIITDMASKDFSDFDYNILPNKCINEAYSTMRPEMPPADHSAGFYLFRVKTGFKVIVAKELKNFVMSDGKKNCESIGLEEEKLKLFYPQGVQDNWKESGQLLGRNNLSGNKKKCRDAIENLLKIKGLIKQETLNNVNATIELMGKNEITGAIEYTRLVTKSMNIVLRSLELSLLGGVQTSFMTDVKWQEILNTFSSLDTILASDIPLISVEFLKYLINSADLGEFTNYFMDHRKVRESFDDPEPCRYTIVPGRLYESLNKIRGSMNELIFDRKKGSIDGLRITFNHIIIEKNKPIPEINYGEVDLDDLIYEFDRWSIKEQNTSPSQGNAKRRNAKRRKVNSVIPENKIKEHIISAELLEAVRIARQELLEHSEDVGMDGGGKIFKKKGTIRKNKKKTITKRKKRNRQGKYGKKELRTKRKKKRK